VRFDFGIHLSVQFLNSDTIPPESQAGAWLGSPTIPLLLY
jgi:hypothetical protein